MVGGLRTRGYFTRNLLGQGKQADVVFRIRPDLCLTHQIDAILLHVHPGREVITIALVITVVETGREVRIRSEWVANASNWKLFL